MAGSAAPAVFSTAVAFQSVRRMKITTTGGLTAVVVGTGFAGKGHAEALRYNGVNVLGMVGRTESVLKDVAESLGIPRTFADLDEALAELHPSIVSVGTPGGAHVRPVESALRADCAVVCDKPLATTASEAKRLYRMARERGLTTAYAASYRYQPHVLLARELVRQGAIGEPWEAECVSHYNLDPMIPFGWSHRIQDGGGRLNNNFTHKLSIVLHILDGAVVEVAGETRNDMKRAPVVEGVHDFRYRERLIPDAGAVNDLVWADVDSEWSYTVMARIAGGSGDPVSALFKHSALQPRYHADYVALYGSEGAMHIDGSYAQGPLYLCKRKGAWHALEVPQRILTSLPGIEDDTQRNWTQLIRELVAHLGGRGPLCFQTFRDGWIDQEVIAAVRARKGWVDIPAEI
jgi:predicted dehydrogenase